MAKTLTLKAEIREQTGTKSAAGVRKEGKIPAIVYGHKEEPVAVSLNSHDFTEGLHHGQRLMAVQLGSKKQNVIVKDIQYDYLGKNIIHADLMRVSASELVKVTVPIELKGTAQGTHEGGIVEDRLDHLEIECKATEIPEKIFVRVTDMHVGDNLHAGEVEMPDGVKLLTAPETLVVTCHTVAAAKSTEQLEEEAPTAPEVIGKEAEPEGGAEAEQG